MNAPRSATTAALFVFSFALSSPANAQAVSENAGDWSVTCSTRLYCVATVTGYSATGEAVRFKLERSNKPDARIFVTTNPDYALDLGMRVDIDVLGLDEDYGVFGEVTKVYKGNEMTFAGAARRTLVQKLREGSRGRVTVEFGGTIGTVAYDVSLNGVTTALLVMDRAQDRIDRRDAAVAWGGHPAPEDEPAAAEKASPAPTVSNVALVQPESAYRVYDLGGLPDSVLKPGYDMFNCDLQNTLNGFGAEVYGSKTGPTAYIVPCQAGDVNVDYYVMLAHRGATAANTYEFESPPDFNASMRTTLVNPMWDPATKTLTSTTYHSPNYDCGVYEIHQYSEEADFFELIEYREKSDCNGVTTPPEGFPLSWTIDEMGQ